MSKRARLFVLPQEWLVIERFFQSAADSMVSGLNVPRVGLTNGALRQLEKEVASVSSISEGAACNFVAEVVGHLVDGNIFSRVGERKDREPIGILQPNCLLSELTILQIPTRETKIVPKSVFKKLRAFWQAKTSVANLSLSLREMGYAKTAAECNRWVKRLRLLELFVNMGTAKEPIWVRTLPGFEKFAYQIVEDDTRHSYLKDEKGRSRKLRSRGAMAKDIVPASAGEKASEIEPPPIKVAQLRSSDGIVVFLTQRLQVLEEQEEEEKEVIVEARKELETIKVKINNALRDGKEIDEKVVRDYNENKRMLDRPQKPNKERQMLISAYSQVLADLKEWVSADAPPAESGARIVLTPSVLAEIAVTDKFKSLSGPGKIAVITVGSPFAETGFYSSQMIHYIVEKGMKFWEKRDFHSFLAGACRPVKKRAAFFVRAIIPFDGRPQAKENCDKRVKFFHQLTDAGREFARQFLESLNK